jgi:hypothetical protein
MKIFLLMVFPKIYRRNLGKANAAKRPSDFSGFKLLWKIIQDASLLVLKASNVCFWEKLFGNACFSRSATTNNYADLPVIILNGKGAFEALLQLNITKREAAHNALRSETFSLVPAFYNVKIRSL